MINQKIKTFVELLEKELIATLHKKDLSCQCNIDNLKVSIKEGKKYTKVNIGGSGRYMIDEKENIYGIKAYGVIHRGYKFGNLNTISNYYWGNYRAVKKERE